MPHTNRKKQGSAPKGPAKRIVHTKRQQVEDEDGWTHVIDAPSSRHRTVDSEKLALGGKSVGGDYEIKGSWYVNRTLEELGRDLEYYARKWDESDANGALRMVLEEGKEAGKRAVTDVVCLGLGSLVVSRREHRRASWTQFVALRSIMSTLGISKLTLQDPTFTPIEKEFFTSLGYTVLEDPEAFECITESTLVYAIHCYVELYLTVSERPTAALLVMNNLDEYAGPGKQVPEGLEKMIEGCEGIVWPEWNSKGGEFRTDFAFTMIYWRKNDGVDGVESIVVERRDGNEAEPKFNALIETDTSAEGKSEKVTIDTAAVQASKGPSDEVE